MNLKRAKKQQIKNLTLDIVYSDIQDLVFFQTQCKRKVITKGRRVGFTRGSINYVAERLLEGFAPILWIDTTYGQIDKYVEWYLYPVLKQLPDELWDWRAQKRELIINGNLCDFRSAERPENIEGFGYRLIIINEAGIVLKNPYLWYNCVLPMAMDYGAEIIIGGTPKGKKNKGEEALYYKLFKDSLPKIDFEKLTEFEKKNISSVSFNFSSFDNPFIKDGEVDELLKEFPNEMAKQEIYGLFIDTSEFHVFRPEWFKLYKVLPPIGTGMILQSWDTAYKTKEVNDYSVCTTWFYNKLGIFLMDLWQGKLEFPELCIHAKILYDRYKPNTVLIEDCASGQSIIQELKKSTTMPIKAISVDKDKIARANAITPTMAAGHVHFPEGKKFTADLISLCEDFPDVIHDDPIDSMTQAVNYIRQTQIVSEMKTLNTNKMPSILQKY